MSYPPAASRRCSHGATEVINHVDPDLTLWGLRLIYRRNSNQMNDLPPQSGATCRNDRERAVTSFPLGGAGEIGMNLNLYGYAGDWLIVDCGVTFGDDSQPGLEVVMPDPAFIVERRDRLLGIVATHAHEDHIGAIPYSVDAAALPGLGDAVHRLAAARQARRGRHRRQGPDQRRADVAGGSRSARSTSN